MRIKFNYDNVSPEDLKAAFDCFVEKYKNFKLTRDGKREDANIEYKSVDLYFGMTCGVDKMEFDFGNKDGELLYWIVQPHESKNSRRNLVEQRGELYIYEEMAKPRAVESYV